MNELAEVHKYAALWNEGKAALSFPTLPHFVWLIFLVWLSHPTLKFTTSTKLLSTPIKTIAFLFLHTALDIICFAVFFLNQFIFPSCGKPPLKKLAILYYAMFYDIMWKFLNYHYYAIILLKSWDYSIFLTFITYIPLIPVLTEDSLISS